MYMLETVGIADLSNPWQSDFYAFQLLITSDDSTLSQERRPSGNHCETVSDWSWPTLAGGKPLYSGVVFLRISSIGDSKPLLHSQSRSARPVPPDQALHFT